MPAELELRESGAAAFWMWASHANLLTSQFKTESFQLELLRLDHGFSFQWIFLGKMARINQRIPELKLGGFHVKQ